MEKYSKEKAEALLKNLSDWKLNNDGIERKFQFKDFKEALEFINRIGQIAEKMNHHPEIFNVYNKVNLRLSTHDAGGLTNMDFEFAKAIE